MIMGDLNKRVVFAEWMRPAELSEPPMEEQQQRVGANKKGQPKVKPEIITYDPLTTQPPCTVNSISMAEDFEFTAHVNYIAKA